ncbi:MAG: hypothetical protein P1U65_07510 [Minwuia sp.]|nr:hypothetical protein [Minwuia sp.]
MNRLSVSDQAMRLAAEYARAHLQYQAGQPDWTLHEAFVMREMPSAGVLHLDCKGFAMNVAQLLYTDLMLAHGGLSENSLRRALRIGFFDCDPHDLRDEDHVACMAWSGTDWHLVADTMERDPLALPRVQDVTDRRWTAWVDLTDLATAHMAGGQHE